MLNTISITLSKLTKKLDIDPYRPLLEKYLETHTVSDELRRIMDDDPNVRRAMDLIFEAELQTAKRIIWRD